MTMIVSMVVHVGIAIAIIQLMGWHVYFTSVGITTFTYIQFSREKKLKDEDLKKKRINDSYYNKWYEKAWAELERFSFKPVKDDSKALTDIILQSQSRNSSHFKELELIA